MIGPQQREHILKIMDLSVEQGARRHVVCEELGLSLRTVQRWKQGDRTTTIDGRTQRAHTPSNKLSHQERQAVLEVVNSPAYAHLPPSQIVPILADQGRYIASESTIYRILRDEGLMAHRRSERPPRSNAKPRAFCATRPNQLYSWDITYLPAATRGVFFYLYLFMDIFSRKIVGWQIYEHESSEQASEVLKDLCRQEGIQKDQVVLHSDNGAAMRGATLLATLQTLGIMPSLSRPSVSNDNPYSESLFKTLKYRPCYPLDRFDSLAKARAWAEKLVHWYNHEHRHSSLSFVTPAQRHAAQDQSILNQRKKVYEQAKELHPHRWSRSVRAWKYVDEVMLNPDKPNQKERQISTEHTVSKAA